MRLPLDFLLLWADLSISPRRVFHQPLKRYTNVAFLRLHHRSVCFSWVAIMVETFLVQPVLFALTDVYVSTRPVAHRNVDERGGQGGICSVSSVDAPLYLCTLWTLEMVHEVIVSRS